jgi:hypothetical protein
MGIEKIFILVFSGTVILAITTVAFRKMLYTWILLAGAIGIPVLSVRQSNLMFSELLLAPLLFLWFTEKKLALGFIKLSELSSTKTNIEKSMWAMIGAFTISSVFGIVFKDPSLVGEHGFIIGKLTALFLYVAPVMAALVIADSISSFKDVLKISYLLIILGIFTFFVKVIGFTRVIQGGFAGWSWMNISLLFSFSIAYLLFHPKITRKLQNYFLCSVLAVQTFSAYFLGIGAYKAIFLANFVIVFTVFYFRSRAMTFLIFCISIIIFIASFATFNYYMEKEREEGSWGRIGIWQHSLSIVKKRPILGVGPYNYYDYSLYVASKKRGADSAVITSPHGQYIQILVETGAVGALAFLWFMRELFKLLKYFLKLNSDYSINVVSSAVAAILLSRLAIGIVGDYLISQYHNGGLQSFCVTVYFWICLGVLIGLRRIVMFDDEQDGANEGLRA